MTRAGASWLGPLWWRVVIARGGAWQILLNHKTGRPFLRSLVPLDPDPGKVIYTRGIFDTNRLPTSPPLPMKSRPGVLNIIRLVFDYPVLVFVSTVKKDRPNLLLLFTC